jgi:hypothetical protein
MRLTGRLINVSELTPSDRREMLALMDRHYQGVSPERFAADLENKDWVIGLFDRTHEWLGFSTQTVLTANVAGLPVRALFSGDTIVSREHWGDPALSHVWGQLSLKLIDHSDDAALYWFLISQGFRTYRFLPVFFHEYYPRYDVPTPPPVQEVLMALASQRFADYFDAAGGVVRAGRDQYCLRESLAEVPESRRRDPHVAYFLRANPGYAAGDELCCLAPLTRENFTAAAWRVINADNTSRALPSCRSPQV